ncbi:MAG: hypothetical protein GOV02_02050, partial [Candidatus Aenigmarchaeota archaeon]|nr:hypothetical protein [Candidatus Aenigmarchaeota archaeon]
YEPKKDEDVPYNMMITVMGPQEQRALEILEEFGEKVDIEIRNAPQSLVEFYDEMSHRFG